MRVSTIIFYGLLVYALTQMFSWGSLVIRLQPQRMAMIVGEGSVFLFLLIVGAYFIRKSIVKESKLKEQQQNFLLSVTHELKSPLAAIKISLETLIKRDLAKDMRLSLFNNSLKVSFLLTLTFYAYIYLLNYFQT